MIDLSRLNPGQQEAVTASPEGGLQIIAGPGSGKTHVLATRIAYLISHFHLDPSEIVVVTFSNKASREMKARIASLVGDATLQRLVIGTFHSVCVSYLRRYGTRVGLANSGFGIPDRDDCVRIVRRILESMGRKELKPAFFIDAISRSKSAGVSAEQYSAQAHGMQSKAQPCTQRLAIGYTQGPRDTPVRPSAHDTETRALIAEVYIAYEGHLRAQNLLDFDDLLLYGLALFARFPRIIRRVRTVLVDEFQDTNRVQYDLLRAIAGSCRSLTVVGDPDQSIYGWRSADITNLARMTEEFAPVHTVWLETNYRSTGAILGAALAVVREDPKRLGKGLVPTHATGVSCVLHRAGSAAAEARFIADRITALRAYTGNLIGYGDIAVLLRYGALSRAVELALTQAGIPARTLGGASFFSRSEVRDMVGYLQLADNPAFTAAFVRVVNVPRRGIGEKTLKEIIEWGEREGVSAFEVCERLGRGGASNLPRLTPAVIAALTRFVDLIHTLQERAAAGTPVADLIRDIYTAVNYQAYLESQGGSGRSVSEQEENIKELQAYATQVAEQASLPDYTDFLPDDEDDEGAEYDGGGADDADGKHEGAEKGLPPGTNADPKPHTLWHSRQSPHLAQPDTHQDTKPSQKDLALSPFDSGPPSPSTPPHTANTQGLPNFSRGPRTSQTKYEEPHTAQESSNQSREPLSETRGTQNSKAGPTPTQPKDQLKTFLSVSSLSTDVEESGDSSDKADDQKVTISTCHAAKGLEWPVVFVPACEDGVYPFYRATDAEQKDEERRLLYVAMTRAQAFCILSYSTSRMMGAETSTRELSPFISSVSQRYPSLFLGQPEPITRKVLLEISRVIGREDLVSSEEAVRKQVAEYESKREHSNVAPHMDKANLPGFQFQGKEAKQTPPTLKRPGASDRPGGAKKPVAGASLATRKPFKVPTMTRKPFKVPTITKKEES